MTGTDGLAAAPRVFVGFDPSQMRASAVAEASLRARASGPVDVRRVAMAELQARGLYTRPTTSNGDAVSGYWDVISGAAMSTGHAIARFLVPLLCGHEGLALFTDGDVLFREDVAHLFAMALPRYAVQVVQHAPIQRAGIKMEGQAQALYARKNWSSVMLLNCGHPANRALDAALVNSVPGRDLHRFCWLDDELIGPLPARWNVLIGEEEDRAPAIAHFTLGVPDMPGYEHQPHADEWYAQARACGYRLSRPPRTRPVLARTLSRDGILGPEDRA